MTGTLGTGQLRRVKGGRDRSSQDRSSRDRSSQGRSSQERSSQDMSSQILNIKFGYLLTKIHLRLEFDSGVGPTCQYIIS